MARIRTVKPEFWSHPVIGRLSESAQLLALALLNFADDEGYFLAEPALVRNFARPFDDDYRKTMIALSDLSHAGWIEVGKSADHGPIGRIVNFSKHQYIQKANLSKLKAYWYDSDTIPVSYEYRPDQGSGIRDQGKERNNLLPLSVEGKNSNGHSKHQPFKELIFKCYNYLNGEDPPWDGSDAKQLSALIKSKPDLGTEKFHQWLGYYSASLNINGADRPRKFLPNICSYANGPLNQYGKPLEEVRK